MTRRLLPALLLAAVLVAGCGQEQSGDVTTDPVPSSPPASSPVGAPFTEVAVLTATAAGGTVSSEPTLLDNPAAVDAFVAQFERPGLDEDVRAAVAAAEVPQGHVLVGAVIALGCDVPPGVDVDTTAGLAIVAQKVASPMRECFAAMTSVAVLTLDSSLL